MTQQEYFNTVWPLCLEASAKCGVHPEIIFAQSALETGYGLHHPGNNYFGIKAGPSTGVSASTADITTEYINGVATRLQQHFAGYPSMASSFLGYALFLRNNRRYKSFEAGGSISSQLVALGTSGYATDPNYAMKIGKIVDLVPQYLKEYPGTVPQVKSVPKETTMTSQDDPNVVHETGILADIGHDVDEALNPVKSLVSELTAHKTGLQVAVSLATSLLPYAPIPAAASMAATDILNGLSGLANKPIPATTTMPAQPAPPTPVEVEPVPVPADVADALSDGEAFISTLYGDFTAGNLSLKTVEAAAEAEIPTVIGQAEQLFAPALGIDKDPNAN